MTATSMNSGNSQGNEELVLSPRSDSLTTEFAVKIAAAEAEVARARIDQQAASDRLAREVRA